MDGEEIRARLARFFDELDGLSAVMDMVNRAHAHAPVDVATFTAEHLKYRVCLDFDQDVAAVERLRRPAGQAQGVLRGAQEPEPG